jgi:hypothetical protein
MSLGGVRDEAEIRGHRRTYIGAMPGQIIQGIRRAETNDPVYMLDEIDKVGRDYRGDPTAALLEALDPEQNFTFRDNYLDVTFDLSKVLFITTANQLDTIPDPLRDRMEIIELHGYTEEDKQHITYQYLIKRQIEENGLTQEQIEFTPDAVSFLIRHYTREAGVRSLERQIGTICRKQARRRVEGKTEKMVVTRDVVQEMLGGIVRLPREIDEQSIVPMGHFLARYGAVEFARVEDRWGFLATGAGSFEAVKGIVQIARDTDHTVSLATGKTKPSDATLDDFRALRGMVNKAALNGRTSAYYLDTTWETRLPSFRTQAEPNVYQRLPDGSAILDGYPIVWTDVLEPYGTAASPAKPIAVFGALSFWWMGEHGTPRIDTSEHVWFSNDQLAVRFIEEIDFDYAATDATAALLTAQA